MEPSRSGSTGNEAGTTAHPRSTVCDLSKFGTWNPRLPTLFLDITMYVWLRAAPAGGDAVHHEVDGALFTLWPFILFLFLFFGKCFFCAS